jgi:putative membrane-bound dehydrogenase-like protein
MSPRLLMLACFLLAPCLSRLASAAAPDPGSSANRLAYLDDPCDPYVPSHRFPALTTPQWIGDPGVEAAVVLAIDDMSQYAAYEVYLRPILERLKQIDGRAPLSIMGTTINLAEPQLQVWLKEGVSLETHTTTHPCPLLAGGDLAKAKADYDRSLEHFHRVPHNDPVGFRTPCMDGINSTTPRLFAEVLMGTTSNGYFAKVSSSVAQVFTPEDPGLPRDRVVDASGKGRFARYLAPGFVNLVENHPYPYVVARGIWELPFSVPDDYQGFSLQGNKNPGTLADMETALDLVVLKKGLYTQCFHPYAWIANTQMVAFIDHAVRRHGGRVRFLNMREVEERLTRNALGGEPLRATNGQANGVVLLDLNHDGLMDVVVGNERVRQTRVWNPARGAWDLSPFPCPLVHVSSSGSRGDNGARFGIIESGTVVLLARNESQAGAWRFEAGRWVDDPGLLEGLEIDGRPVLFADQGRDRGVRLRDIDNDGTCEVLVGNESQSAVFRFDPAGRRWKQLPYGLPPGAAFVNAQGADFGLRLLDLNGDGALDSLFSNEEGFGLHLMVPKAVLGFVAGWSREVIRGRRGQTPEIPRVVRAGEHRNNGAWFAGGEMRVGNEDTATLPGLVQRVPFADLLAGLQPPALSPTQSLAAIQAPDGFVVELVAQEPLTRDPVYLDWGEDGRMWVVEMHDYPLGVDGHGKSGGTVRFLEDTDGDGRYDRSTVFLDNVNFPNGLIPWKRGVLISAAPGLLYAEDTDGDGHADRVETLFTGFVEGNQQHRFNGFDYGLDNWLYGANGDSGGRIRRPGGASAPEVSISGRDFRLRPDAGVFEAIAGHTQFGRHRDDWGNWFGNANPVWLWHYWIPDQYLKRNPRLPVERISRETATYPEAGRVLAVGRKQQRMNDVGQAGHVTSANSPTPYRDDLFGTEFARAVFISEPVHNAVRCEILHPDGVSFTSTRWNPDQSREFLVSTDPWFRPTGMKTGPDGALYIADMYRQYIEHPEWIPDDIKTRFNMRAGEDLGRIYRVYPRGAKLRPAPRLDRFNDAELARAIDHPGGWQRDTVQRLIVSGQRRGAGDGLRQVARESANPKARLGALCTLEGLGLLEPADLVRGLEDVHPGVRENAVRVAESSMRGPAPLPGPLAAALLARAEDPELRVRFQLALSLGEWDDPRAVGALARIALSTPGNREVRVAVASSASRHPAALFEALVGAGGDAASQEELLAHLVMLAAAPADTRVVEALASRLTTPRVAGTAPEAWQLRSLARLVEELERGGRPIDRFPELRRSLGAVLDAARGMATNEEASVAARGAAVTLLGRASAQEEADAGILAGLLSARSPQSLQQAALARLGELRSPAVPAVLVRHWASLPPGVRVQAFDVFLRREPWITGLLDRIEAREVSASDFGVSARQRLLTHASESVRTRARKLLAEPVRADRQSLINAYLPQVTRATGEPSRGAARFQQHCVVCHRLGDEGQGAAPDLASVVDRSPERMLVAILDPNRAVEDRYMSYTARTRGGEELTGMLVGETANSITLVSASGIRETVLRRDLESLASTRTSLMPEGFEQALKPQDIADLIAYVDAAAVPRRTFPGNHPGLVRPDVARALRLTADAAELFGTGIAFESQYRNLGMWNGPSDRAVWTAEVPAPGAYEVWLHWACDGGEAGDSFKITAGSQSLVGTVPSTGSWDVYQSRRFGRFELPAGRVRVSIAAEPGMKGYLMDLREVRLVPAGQSGQPDFEPPGTALRARP